MAAYISPPPPHYCHEDRWAPRADQDAKVELAVTQSCFFIKPSALFSIAHYCKPAAHSLHRDERKRDKRNRRSRDVERRRKNKRARGEDEEEEDSTGEKSKGDEAGKYRRRS